MPTNPESNRPAHPALDPAASPRWADSPRPNLPTFSGFKHVDIDCLPYTLTRREIRAEARKNRRLKLAKAGLALSSLVLLAAIVPAGADSDLGKPGRQMPAGCTGVTVAAGDTAWAIAGKAGIDLGTLARNNAHIESLRLIRPGDELAVSCTVPVKIIDPLVLERNEVQQTRTAPQVDAEGKVSKQAILHALHTAGARGEQLVTLAALTEGESGRRLAAVGDADIATPVWGPSYGVFQIRSLVAETGKGTTRDAERCKTLEGGALSAVELWNQSVQRGKPGGTPWTAYLRNWNAPYMDEYRALASSMGLL